MEKHQSAQHTTHTVQGNPASVPAGTPVYVRSETTVPVTQPAAATTFEYWTPILAFVLLVAGVVALFTNGIGKKIKEAQEAHKPSHDALDTSINDMRHDLKNLRQRQDGLEASRAKDEARFVKLESDIQGFRETAARIERNQEKQAEVEAEGRKEIIQSLRELREVKPRA